MRATAFEFRYRLAISTLIYVLGFWAPWIRFGSETAADPQRLWSWLAIALAKTRLLTTANAFVAITVLAIVVAILGGAFRVLGTAYLGRAIVLGKTMQAGAVMAAGPYRYVRNPLYLGSLLTAFAASILMPVSGALFVIVVLTLFVLRLVGGEEAFLRAQTGEPYLAYCRRVHRWIPSLSPRIEASLVKPKWLPSILAEAFPVGFAACLLVFAWSYDANLLIRCVLICFGISLILRAFHFGESSSGAA